MRYAPRSWLRSRKKGFTLIEILVVVAITIMVSAFAVSYSKIGQNQVTLYIEAQKLAGLIFRAKTLAIATYNDPVPTLSCGYGLEINYSSGQYRIFSYDPLPPIFDCSAIVSVPPPSRRTVVSPSSLNAGVVFNNAPADSLHLVLFVPPDPRTLLSNDAGGAISGGPATIYLETADGSANTSITVSLAGQVDF